jgi:Rod binding domain-containing protein
MDTNFPSAMLSLQNPAIQKPQNTMLVAKAEKAANEFEAMFIGQFLGSMFQGIGTNELMGGGQGETMFRSLLIEQYAQSVQKQGGFGLAASVKSQLMKLQHIEPQAAAQ